MSQSCDEFLYEFKQTIKYEEKTRKLDSEFLTINELIEELEYLKEQVGGDAIVHLLDQDEVDSQLDDVTYIPLGITHSVLVKHIENIKAGLIVSRTKDYYRTAKRIRESYK